MSKIQYAGEFEFHELTIFATSGAVVDLLTDLIVQEINIFEDIYRNSISGSIIVTDTDNIINKTPLIGQEELSIKIATPSLTATSEIIDFTGNKTTKACHISL